MIESTDRGILLMSPTFPKNQMTNEEAMYSLKDHLKVRSDAYYDYLQSGGKADCGEEYFFDVLDTAIEALEKQIPKKPVHKKETYESHDWRKDEDGNIDEFAFEYDTHNGPCCQRCGERFCMFCEDDYEEKLKEPCVLEYYVCPECSNKVKYKEHHCECGKSLKWSEESTQPQTSSKAFV